jgi:hypothetical protein
MTEAIQKAFEDAQKQSLEAVMILGLNEKGGITINSSVNNFAAMHWMLNQSVFDICVFQRNAKDAEQEETEEKSE